MKYEQYDQIILKDGRGGAIVEILSDEDYLVDIGHDETTWDTITVTKDQIDRKTFKH